MNKNAEQYVKILLELKDKMKWKFADPRNLMMVAGTYVVHNKPFDWNKFHALSEHMKNESSFFSPLKSNYRYTLAAGLDTLSNQPEYSFSRMVHVYEDLVASGFGKTVFTYIAAMVLLEEDQQQQKLAQKARDIYKAMKKEHSFLTTHSDYPLAALLAKEKDSVETLTETMEYYYKELKQRGFRIGNDLQFLSHILSIDKQLNRTRVLERCETVYHALEEFDFKQKTMYYPTVGLLALLENGEQLFPTIKALYEQLNGEKSLKWNKDLNFMMAVSFTVSEESENTETLITGLSTTIETIIQAQQAAMTAAMIGAAAASNSGN
ncbi:DUF4003 domain-containing protein [Radiobacillus kanasensis]|uniref:DUF4003 family protein n=1 Tax=Radiobacillus kanasensis TaxID=2844358 RepID=UPI001E58F52B|nr:DUF4003 family protein [Radiobacillus kanasensis]UFU00644.1 DUF4003 domain-containing protein [Radiobacillus kanasensis]